MSDIRSAEDVARKALGCVPYHQPRWADGTEGKSWCRTHRHTVNEWPCPEQKALADTLAAWCAERAAEVRAAAAAEMHRIAHVADAEVRADERGRCSVVHATLSDEALVAELVRRGVLVLREGVNDDLCYCWTAERCDCPRRRRYVTEWEPTEGDA